MVKENQFNRISKYCENKAVELKPLFKDEKLYNMFRSAVVSFGPKFVQCTAASYHHHNFIGGLFVHTFEMLDILKENYYEHPERAMKFNPKSRPGNTNFDFGMCATAIIFHDWGKMFEYDNSNPTPPDMKFPNTWALKSMGHIFMGSELIGQWCDQFGIAERTKKNLQHIILSHHTKREWGSPIAPLIAEAKIVCACDMISSRYASEKPNYLEEYLLNGNQIDCEKVYTELVEPYMNEVFKQDELVRTINKLNLWDKVTELIENENNNSSL